MSHMLLLAEASILAALVRVAVRVARLPRVVALLDASRSQRRRPVDVAACLDAANAASARFAHPSCLYRSLVAFGLLSRRGAPVTFHLGARAHAAFGAHAWISLDGRALDREAGPWFDLWQCPASRDPSR